MQTAKHPRKPTPARATVTEVRRSLAEYVERAQYTGARTEIIRRGKRIAAIVSVADVEYLEKHAPDGHPVAIPA
jgi:prevent-host-death family protein